MFFYCAEGTRARKINGNEKIKPFLFPLAADKNEL